MTTGWQGIKQVLKYPAIRAGLEASALAVRLPGVACVGGRGLIFTMHHVEPSGARHAFDPNAGLIITPDFLEQAIVTVLKAGLVPVHAPDLPALLSDPSDQRRFVSFTLDDGYRNNARYAAPVFERYGVPFTIFPTIDFIKRSRSLWWETAEVLLRNADVFHIDFGNGEEPVRTVSVREKYVAYRRLVNFVKTCDEDEAVRRIDAAARAQAIEPLDITDNLIMNTDEIGALGESPHVHFGGHTLTHVNLRRVSNDRLDAEITGSIIGIEALSGKRPRSFAYPYGWHEAVSRREANAVSTHGFVIGVTTRPGMLDQSVMQQPALLPRVSLNGLYQKPRYVRALISGLPFKLT